jgi:hypothetical protein
MEVDYVLSSSLSQACSLPPTQKTKQGNAYFMISLTTGFVPASRLFFAAGIYRHKQSKMKRYNLLEHAVFRIIISHASSVGLHVNSLPCCKDSFNNTELKKQHYSYFFLLANIHKPKLFSK